MPELVWVSSSVKNETETSVDEMMSTLSRR